MITTPVSATYGCCASCGHFAYLGHSDRICQDCYWSERDHTDNYVPTLTDDDDHVILNHYRGL